MSASSLPSIFLVGPMGAGKSTLGRYLAQQLGRSFYDSDRVIMDRTGADIPLIFDKEGEEGFRRREEDVIDELTCLPDIVLATGGGAVLSETNRHRLHERGVVFYLCAPVAVQVARTRHDRNRPLLQTSDPEQRLRELFMQRDPLYREVAHHVVSTASGNLRRVADEVLGCLGQTGRG